MQLDTITLPDDLLWINEFEWNPVEQHVERSLTGALLVQEGKFNYGRSIILTGGDNAGWVRRRTILDLYYLSEIANKVMMLTLPDKRQFNVVFDRKNGSSIQAKQLWPQAYISDDDIYTLSLKLITIN